MHYAQVTHRGQNYRHGQLRAKHSSSQIAYWRANRLAWSKCNGVESPTVFAKCPFAFGTSIDVVENNSWHPTVCQLAQILNVQRSRNDGWAQCHLAVRTG